MGKLLCGIILLVPILTAIVAKDWTEEWAENGEKGFDLDWFWMGSNLKSLGRPKFKISEHPDGYSAQFGFEDYYMRARYTISDNSIDFNVMDWKGSAKFTHTNRRSPVPPYLSTQLAAELELVSPDPNTRDGPGGERAINGNMKMKYSRGSIDEPHVIVLSLSNIGKIRTYTRFPTFKIRDITNMEAVLRIVINERSPEESTAEFSLGMKGNMYKYGGGERREPWAPGSYNLSSSLTVIQMDYSNEKQPKMAAALDFSEDIRYDNEDQNDSPRNEDGLKKSIVLSGMLDLTNEGSRLAVLKATDAETDKPFGRLEALRPDEENCRMELYVDGENFGALKLHHSPSTMNLTIETDDTCGPPSNETEDADVDLGCNEYRLLEMDMEDKDTIICRMYEDLRYINAPPSIKERYIPRSMIHEHMLVAKDDYCGYDMSFSSRFSNCTFSGSMFNGKENTIMEHGYLNSVYDYDVDAFKEEYKEEMRAEMYPVENDEYNLKLKYNNERIFEGWTKWQTEMRKWAIEHMADMKENVNGMHETYGKVVEALSEI